VLFPVPAPKAGGRVSDRPAREEDLFGNPAAGGLVAHARERQKNQRSLMDRRGLEGFTIRGAGSARSSPAPAWWNRREPGRPPHGKPAGGQGLPVYLATLEGGRVYFRPFQMDMPRGCSHRRGRFPAVLNGQPGEGRAWSSPTVLRLFVSQPLAGCREVACRNPWVRESPFRCIRSTSVGAGGTRTCVNLFCKFG
jgi:hypothetical protein